jgi:nitroreductase
VETTEAILTRRSIRRFRPDPVPPEVLEGLMRVAMAGPSASNQRPWQFLVLTEPERLKKLSKVRGYEIAAHAPAVILVCGDQERNRIGEVWVMDCSIAAQNILLAAHSAGLGAVWLGCWPAPERMPNTSRFLDLPWQIVPFAVLVLGYADESPPQTDRYEPERVHYDRW